MCDFENPPVEAQNGVLDNGDGDCISDLQYIQGFVDIVHSFVTGGDCMLSDSKSRHCVAPLEEPQNCRWNGETYQVYQGSRYWNRLSNLSLGTSTTGHSH